MVPGKETDNRMGKKIKKEVEPPPKDVTSTRYKEDVTIRTSEEYSFPIMFIRQHQFDPLTIESKKAATVVLMLNSPEEEILAKACEAIYKFALKGEENKATLLELGAVEPLTKLLTHEDKIVRRNATMIFGILASNSDVKKLLRELEVMNSVIAQLAPEEEVVIHEFASLCLANMSMEYTGKVQIFEHGGLEPLIRLLSSPDPDDFQCRTTLQELNPIPPMLELLKSEYPIIQLLALKTLGVITCDKESRTMLKDNQGLDQLSKILEIKIVQLLKSDNEEVREAAALALANLTTSSTANANIKFHDLTSSKNYLNALRAAAEADAIDPLINILSSKRDGAIANAATVLTNMAIQEPLRTVIQSREVMHALLGPLRSTNTVVQSTAALTVAATACDVETRNQINPGTKLLPLKELCLQELNDQRAIILVNSKSDMKGKGKKEEEKVKEEEEVLAVPKMTEGSLDKEWYPPPDPEFCMYVYEVTKSILPITNIKDQIETLAKISCHLLAYGPEPQALADKIGVGCCLVRGEYCRGWNEVKLLNEARKGIIGNLPPPEEYIVDLMFHPGALLKLRSKEADLYRFL
ncbi:hypothetical protein A6R68_06272 [Neotoma lepida]|uniref:Armadillo repeat-containing domain-containing protein n=1 Tax=Neotoma lepida TaxID=56216 RepID=A0A1A6GG03_NEOLE|nr:hypothetical protein A6R68_06272 [Neotoma lepida]